MAKRDENVAGRRPPRLFPTDPEVRRDGRCAGPGCRKYRRPGRSKRYGGEAARVDPFCSRACCERFYAELAK